MLALGMSILQSVYAQGDAYSKGYKDALCDKLSCNGHGYEPSCPGDHSSEYCNNYRDGYAAGWDASTNANSNGQQQPSPPPPFSQAPNQDQSQSQSQGSTNNNNNNPSTNYNNNNPNYNNNNPNYNNNNPTIIIVPPK